MPVPGGSSAGNSPLPAATTAAGTGVPRHGGAAQRGPWIRAPRTL